MSTNCSTPNITENACIVEEPSFGPSTPCNISEFDPFTIYAYETPNIPGLTFAEHEQRARDRLINGEEKRAEDRVWSMIADVVSCDDETSVPGWWALGIADEYAAEVFNGGGVIHMSRRAAMALALHLVVEGSTLRTKLGTPVVAGAGYGTSLDGPANSRIFVTGPLVMYRSEIDVVSTVDKSINQMSIIAQRDYVIGWDCEPKCVLANLCAPMECVPEEG
jgi:hypothetical protein